MREGADGVGCGWGGGEVGEYSYYTSMVCYVMVSAMLDLSDLSDLAAKSYILYLSELRD